MRKTWNFWSVYKCVLCVAIFVVPCKLFCLGWTDSYCVRTFSIQLENTRIVTGSYFKNKLLICFNSYLSDFTYISFVIVGRHDRTADTINRRPALIIPPSNSGQAARQAASECCSQRAEIQLENRLSLNLTPVQVRVHQLRRTPSGGNWNAY